MHYNPKNEALKIKNQGNDYFHQQNYWEAVNCYSKAIELDPSNSVLFSNRARCYKLLNKFQQALKDAHQALIEDPHNIKAQLLTGQILLDIAMEEKNSEKIVQAIQKLKKSLSMSSGNKLFQVSLQQKIYRARKNLWQVTLESQNKKKKALRNHMTKLIESDNNITDQQKDLYQQKLIQMLDLNIRTQKSFIPRQLVCHLSRQIMKDPVCNQYGYTYSKKPYLQHVKLFQTDPFSKNPIKNNNLLFPNVSIRKAIDQFLQLNIWAYEQII